MHFMRFYCCPFSRAHLSICAQYQGRHDRPPRGVFSSCSDSDSTYSVGITNDLSLGPCRLSALHWQKSSFALGSTLTHLQPSSFAHLAPRLWTSVSREKSKLKSKYCWAMNVFEKGFGWHERYKPTSSKRCFFHFSQPTGKNSLTSRVLRQIGHISKGFSGKLRKYRVTLPHNRNSVGGGVSDIGSL
jgi:hypothetical protein